MVDFKPALNQIEKLQLAKISEVDVRRSGFSLGEEHCFVLKRDKDFKESKLNCQKLVCRQTWASIYQWSSSIDLKTTTST